MGLCNSKPSANPTLSSPKSDTQSPSNNHVPARDNSVAVNGGPKPHSSSVNGENPSREKKEPEIGKKSPFFPFYSPSPAHYLFSKKSPARSPANGSSNSTPKRFVKRPFPPPSPAKHIRALLARRHGSVKPNEATIPEGSEAEVVAGLDKSFGFSKHFANKYEVGDEVGRGHFGYTCSAKFKKGELKGQQVAVKVIPKSKVCSNMHNSYIKVAIRSYYQFSVELVTGTLWNLNIDLCINRKHISPFFFLLNLVGY